MAEWNDALISDKTPWDSDGKGWKRNKNKLQITWTIKNPAPDEVVKSNCKKSRCEKNKFPSFSLYMKCTDLGNCKSCSNVYTDEDVETTEEDDDYNNFDNDDDWDHMTDDEEDLLDHDNMWLASGFLVNRNFLFILKSNFALLQRYSCSI